MKKLLCILLSLYSFSLFSQEMTYGTQYQLSSEILGEDRTYWVYLPGSYNDPNWGKESYPVIYVLDGKSAFFPLCGVVDFMGGRESVNFQIPEVIVVGINTEKRDRDLTPNPTTKMPDGREAQTEAQKLMFARSGGGENFLRFLTDELFPKIESDYRTLPYRVYVGHSLGGLTSSYTLLKHPGIFDGYMAIDPSLWWDGGKYPSEAQPDLEDFKSEKVQRFYMSVIDTSGFTAKSLHAKSIFKLKDQLANYAPNHVQWKVDHMPGTDHSSIPLLSWYHGLNFIFEGYDLNHYGFMQNPDGISSHFQQLKKNTGLDMPPPQSIFEIISHYRTAPNRFPDADAALYIIEMGLKHHPESPFLHEKLGRAYEMKEEKEKAISAYEKALSLNPENKALEKKLEELGQE
ncbi:MAG: alpha/beta hydrolase-fold protein [Bacteroidia bacterium]|nr:alpha/beta hydrolase-fold protein [Bacteroidia bacterium]